MSASGHARRVEVSRGRHDEHWRCAFRWRGLQVFCLPRPVVLERRKIWRGKVADLWKERRRHDESAVRETRLGEVWLGGQLSRALDPAFSLAGLNSVFFYQNTSRATESRERDWTSCCSCSVQASCKLGNLKLLVNAHMRTPMLPQESRPYQSLLSAALTLDHQLRMVQCGLHGARVVLCRVC